MSEHCAGCIVQWSGQRFHCPMCHTEIKVAGECPGYSCQQCAAKDDELLSARADWDVVVRQLHEKDAEIARLRAALATLVDAFEDAQCQWGDDYLWKKWGYAADIDHAKGVLNGRVQGAESSAGAEADQPQNTV